MTQRLRIDRCWDGTPALPDEIAEVLLSRHEAGGLVIDVDAPDHGDASPDGSPGPTDRLWEHEVVEVFLADAGERYLEVELAPGGHHLVIALDGVRDPVWTKLPIDYSVERRHGRWHGRAHVPPELLPPGVCRVNAYAVHGSPPRRRFLAAMPVFGTAPDFHRLDCFVPLTV